MKLLTRNLSNKEHEMLFSKIMKYLIIYLLFIAFGYTIYYYEVSSYKRVLYSFNAQNNIQCKNDLISKKSGWSYNKEKKHFFNKNKTYEIYQCRQEIIKESR